MLARGALVGCLWMKFYSTKLRSKGNPGYQYLRIKAGKKVKSAKSAMAIATKHNNPNSLTAGVLLNAMMKNPAINDIVDVNSAGVAYRIAPSRRG